MSLNQILSQSVSQSVKGHFLPQSDHFIPDCSTGINGITEMPGKTGISVMNGMPRLTGMTEMSRRLE